MVTSTITARLPYPPAPVWEAVTQVDRYPQWRSDLAGVDLPQEGTFVEHSREGIATHFTVTCADPCRRWEFSLENQRITGRWTGLFFPCAEGTRVRFTEQVQPKKWFLRPLVGGYLKKQQARFLRELRQALPEQPSSENGRGGDAPC